MEVDMPGVAAREQELRFWHAYLVEQIGREYGRRQRSGEYVVDLDINRDVDLDAGVVDALAAHVAAGRAAQLGVCRVPLL